MIKKHIFIKTVSFLSAISLVMTVFFIKEKKENRYYGTVIENQYTEAFEQLNSSLNNISLSVEKALYISSAKKMSALSTEIFSEAEIAKGALSKLPLGEGGSVTLYRFLSQVGNYSLSISKKVAAQKEIGQKQREELEMLSDTAKKISEVIADSAIQYNNHNEWASVVESRLSNAIDSQSLASSLTQLEEDLSDYPTLIYDGPYSDHILNKNPLMTANAKEYSTDMAKETAQKVLGDNSIKLENIAEGKIESYRFGNKNATISISKKGGFVVYMRKNRAVKDSKISYKQAILAARSFLEKLDYKQLTDTYYFTDNDICVINFAYFDGETICYTDLIKVGVALDTGEIMLIEASGYLTNHTYRSFTEPKYTVKEARQRVSDALKIEKEAIALIPTDSGGEVRCYEFLCKGKDAREILLYINTRTLEEEQIYILLKADGGTLVK